MSKNKFVKAFALVLSFSFLNEIFFPTYVWALTGGPSQPEVESFEPIGTSEMVDLFSGDFNYNIPLLDVDGYPVNISYHSGMSMDQEASWVGLGWNINPGTINRGMRGLPDDFNGDELNRTTFMKNNKTFGGKLAFHLELAGFKGLKGKNVKKIKKTLSGLIKKFAKNVAPSYKLGFGIFYNNYKGMGFEINADASFSSNKNTPLKLSGGLGLNLNSQQGVGISPNLNMSATYKSKEGPAGFGGSMGIGANMNSRTGLSNVAFRTSASLNWKNSNKKAIYKYRKNREGRASNNVANMSSSVVSMDNNYSPKAEYAFSNISYSFDGSVGAETPFALNIGGTLGGYYSEQGIAKENESNKAYGYNYLHNGDNSEYSVLDFNREKDGSFSKNTPGLPLTNLTYDSYSITGQGIAGSYRAFRGETGVVYDNKVVSDGMSLSGAVDIGLGNAFKMGADAVQNFNTSTSGKWADNDWAEKYKFKSKKDEAANPFYEPYYYKVNGEKVLADKGYLDKFGGYNPVAIRLSQFNKKSEAKLENSLIASKYIDLSGSDSYQMPASGKRAQRERRNQVIQSLTANEATNYALETSIKNYAVNTPYYSLSNSSISRVSGARKGHHTSELTIVKPGGERYVYGIPAYNNFQKDIEFNASYYPSSSTSPIVYYTNYSGSVTNPDVAKQNTSSDQFYNSNEVPGYAHSYLVTGVLSPDYIDRTGDGISDDDFGKAVKFNYSRIHSAYKWRTPYETKSANANDPLKSNPNDQKANLVYGEKEIWLVNSIVTKNYVAEFVVSDREDGLGVLGVDGGKDVNQKLKKLDKIVLYSKKDRLENGANAVPIKTVHFVYDYSLCNGIPNRTSGASGQNGKLTLKKIYFTYENSERGKLNSYQFSYAKQNNSNYNPGYDAKAADRWGNYKPIPAGSVSNADFPYSEQNKTNADKYASAWLLDKILLPSGGEINVEYEADDYSYVQDKKAMQMFKIMGFSLSSNSAIKSSLFERQGNLSADNFDEHNYIRLDISDYPCANDAEFRKKFLEGVNDMFFKMFVDIDGKGHKEYVPGYAQIDVAASGINSSTEAYVKLLPSHLKDDDKGPEVNAIAKASWNFARLHTPYLVFPGSDPTTTGESAVKSFISYWNEILGMAIGPNRVIRNRGFGQNISVAESFIRLNNPNGHKYGGGSRVSKISVSDNWDAMKGATGESFAYGQEYNYNLDDGTSSGVAAYEPMIGGEENPWRQPVAFSNDRKLAPDESFYQETPYGETFFPQASVGYSRVQVRNLQHTNVTANATGYVEHGFYTAKDFPTIAKHTDVQAKPAKPKSIWKILKRVQHQSLVMSQGYTIINNDMHGKQFYTSTYAQGQTSPMSKTTYYYNVGANGRLNNKVTTITNRGVKELNTIAEEYDVMVDLRKEESFSKTFNEQGNIDFSVYAFLPIPIPSLWYSKKEEYNTYKSSVITKVVQQYGILTKTEIEEDGARIATENLAFDKETGEVLVTRTTNEFNDYIYNTTIPAHWAYDGMGHAYRNLDYEKEMHNVGSGGIVNGAMSFNNPSSVFSEGDELIIWRKYYDASGNITYAYPSSDVNNHSHRVWVSAISDAQNKVFLQLRNGNTYGTGYSYVGFKIVRSGRRNMQTTPVGSLVTMADPLTTFFSTAGATNFSKIVDASAIEFADKWAVKCDYTAPSHDQTPACIVAQYTDTINAFNQVLDQLKGKALTGNYSLSVTANNSTLENSIKNWAFDLSSGTSNDGSSPLKGDITDASNTQKFHFAISFDNGTPNGYWNNFKLVAYALKVPTPGSACECALSQYDLLFFHRSAYYHAVLNIGSYTPGAFYLTHCVSNGVTTTSEQLLASQNACSYTSGKYANPYVTGARGNWRPKRTYTYLTGRNYAVATNSRKDGLYASFNPFWVKPVGTAKLFKADKKNWTFTQEVVNYDQFGNEVESRDALSNYSGALFGYNNTLNTAVANNSKLRQMAFDGFEDYPATGTCGPVRHLDFGAVSGLTVSAEKSHTGKYSAKVSAAGVATLNVKLDPCEGSVANAVTGNVAPVCVSCTQVENIIRNNSTLINSSGQIDYTALMKKVNALTGSHFTTDDVKAFMQSCAGNKNGLNKELRANVAVADKTMCDKACDCLAGFAPEPGKYVVSVWVSQETESSSYPNVRLSIGDNKGTTGIVQLTPTGLCIDGWQQMLGEFTVNAGASNLFISFSGGNETTYFDDFRIHPFDSKMKSFVYDDITKKFVSELDENNYATFYEYDEEGHLIRIKKETEKGVMTIKENRSGTFKKSLD